MTQPTEPNADDAGTGRDGVDQVSGQRPWVIPENAQNITASCAWCDWSTTVSRRDTSVSHTCHAAYARWPFHPQPSIFLQWHEYMPVPVSERVADHERTQETG